MKTCILILSLTLTGCNGMMPAPVAVSVHINIGSPRCLPSN